ncbi:MAG: helix-turn-helix domain-containing protein [Lentilitoribacter sp.]
MEYVIKNPTELTRAILLIEEFRKMDLEMQAQQMLLFLMVMEKPDIGMREIEERIGLSGASVSRNVAALSKLHRKNRPGHDLLEAYEDPDDRRYKKVRPTHKGKLVFQSILSIMSG